LQQEVIWLVRETDAQVYRELSGFMLTSRCLVQYFQLLGVILVCRDFLQVWHGLISSDNLKTHKYAALYETFPLVATLRIL
jgi:hypothetical protein